MAQLNEMELDELLREGNGHFTANMYSKVARSNPGESMVLCASSVMFPLAQLTLASDGDTHDELLETLGLPDDDVTKAVFGRLNNNLQTVKGIVLKAASKIYIAKRAELDPEFCASIQDAFDVEVENVDFCNTETANDINSWVEEQTNHRIKDLVSANELDASTCSILLNAIYFNGRWDKPFKEEDTKEEIFHISKDKTITVSMMHNKGLFGYNNSSELNAQLLELPYKGLEAFFIVILPNEVDGLEDLEELLKDPVALQKAIRQMRTYDVDISLPKFKIETQIDLKDVLEQMNVIRIFDPEQAQLTRLLKYEYKLYISKATQKAFIEVNEIGAEAGAANAFKFVTSSAGPPPQSSFIADRPFYYCLNIRRTTVISGRFIQ